MFSLDESIGYTLNVAANLLKKALNEEFKVAGLDILAEQWALLYRLQEKGGINQQELAALTLRDNASVTRSLRILEEKKLIERRLDDDDRRHRYLYLTEAGQELVPRLVACAENTLNRITKGISDRELQLMNSLIQQLVRNIEA